MSLPSGLAGTTQERPCAKLDQALDRAFLVRCRGGTDGGVKAKLERTLLEGWVPDRLVGTVAPERNGLHIVAGDDPGHAAQIDQAGWAELAASRASSNHSR